MVESRAAAHLGRGRLNGHGRRPSTLSVASVRHRRHAEEGGGGRAASIQMSREKHKLRGGVSSVLSLLFPTLHTMYTVRRVAAVLDQVLRTLCPRL